MTRDPCVKERRRVLELLRSILRRAPLSPAQRSRVERAHQVIRTARSMKRRDERRTFVAIREVAEVVVELLADRAGASTKELD